MEQLVLPHLLLAVEVPDGLLWGGIPTLLASAAAAMKVLWNYWTKQQEEKDKATQAHIDGLAAEITRLREAATDRERKIAEREKAHAAKVEELMNLALAKVEQWGEKNRDLQREFVEVAQDFTALAKRLGLEEE